MLEEFNKKLVENYIELAKKSSNVILANLVHGFSENEDTLKKLKSEIAYSFSDMPFSNQWETFEAIFENKINKIKITTSSNEDMTYFDIEIPGILYSIRYSSNSEYSSSCDNMSSLGLSRNSHNSCNIDFENNKLIMDFDIYHEDDLIGNSAVNTFKQMSEKLIISKNLEEQFNTINSLSGLIYDALVINKELAIECIKECNASLAHIIKRLSIFREKQEEIQDIHILSNDKKHINIESFSQWKNNLDNLITENSNKKTLQP